MVLALGTGAALVPGRRVERAVAQPRTPEMTPTPAPMAPMREVVPAAPAAVAELTAPPKRRAIAKQAARPTEKAVRVAARPVSGTAEPLGTFAVPEAAVK